MFARKNKIHAASLRVERFWQFHSSALFERLLTRQGGLTSEEASRRLDSFGPNTLKVAPRRILRQFVSRFSNPLILILLAASVISALLGEDVSFVLISLMVILSVCLDFFQQFRAERAADRLKKVVSIRATILRDARSVEIPVTEVVPGDVVLLSAGDLVPADGLVLQAKDLFLNQALLTGESFPVEKKADPPTELGSEIVNASNAVFMGTSVVSGSGRVLVCNTGSRTSLGEIAESLGNLPAATAFETGLARFGYLIMRLTVGLVLFVLLVNSYFHRPLLESFFFAIALAVGLTPELLPMIVTVTLSRGALRMAKRDVIIKRLGAIQNLGGMDILCSDKTGTITEGKVTLERHVDIDGRDSTDVLKFAYLNSFFETGLKSTIDQAILEHSDVEVTGWVKLDEVPFDFERRRVSVLAEREGRKVLIVKGATDEILGIARNYVTGESGQTLAIDETSRGKVAHLRDDLERKGFRTIGIAWKAVSPELEHARVSDESDLIFGGIAAFYDPPKEGVGEVLRNLRAKNVSLKVITGDSEWVTRHLFECLALEIVGSLTGEEIQEMSQEALEIRAENCNLFCRVSPSQKNRIIHALKARGHVVGYIGDGVNDAPALHSADVGISVESAVDVAKDAADIILLKQDLNVLNDGVSEGRRTHLNIMKYIMMGASSNLGNMVSMAGATLILPFLPMLPIQVLVNNFLYDVSEITIPMDRVDESRLNEPQRWDVRFVHKFMWVIGLVSSAFDFLTFYVMRSIFKADESLFRTGWFIESIATQVLVIFVIRTRARPWRSRPHWALATTSISVVAIAAMLPFTFLARSLGFVPLSFKFFGILSLMVFAYLAVAEGAKSWFFRKYASS